MGNNPDTRSLAIARLVAGATTALVACGGREDIAAKVADAGAPDGGSLPASDSGAPDASSSGAESRYQGAITATLEFNEGNVGSTLDAWFAAAFGPVPTPSPSCSADGIHSGLCCAMPVRIALPGPVPPPPTAGNVMIARGGSTLGTLLAPAYAEVTGATWSPGDVLGVSAAGADVAPFSGTLRAPGTFAPLDPPLGSGGLTLPRTTPFRVSWNPESFPTEQVQLVIEQIQNGDATVIECLTSDADAEVQVDPILLAMLTAGAASVHLIRTITTYADAPNAMIALVGNLWLDGPITVQ
jgi:hypothetical protein